VVDTQHCDHPGRGHGFLEPQNLRRQRLTRAK
jgi:hypothetical protein